MPSMPTDQGPETTDAPDPFEIAVATVHGVATKVFVNAPSSLRAVWDASAAHGPATFLVYGDQRITFDAAHRTVRALAARLIGGCGVVPGDRVAIAMRNYPEHALAFWAIQAIGAIAVPLNAWWSGPELAYGLTDSQAKVLIADDERLERVEPLLRDTAVAQIIRVRTNRVTAGVPVIPWDEAVAGAAPELPELSVDPDDDACIMYTSGTTGKPKGAVATHRNFVSFLMNILYRGAVAAAAAPPLDPASPPPAPPQPCTLLTFPLFHVGGLQSFLLMYTHFGGRIVLMYKWDVHEALDLIERERVQAVAAVPTTMFELLEVAAAEGRDLSSLTGLSAGATLVPPELVRRIDTQLASKAAPTNGYGLTETSGAAIVNSGASYVQRPDSVGRPVSPVMEVCVVDPDGAEVPTGEVGEIWLKGPTIVRGYFNNPTATAATFTDGWFHTGDLGRLDAEGYLYVVDRIKDVVIRGGENVYAAEVEAAIYEHPDVLDAAIIGVPHERLGEEVGAVVRLRPGSTLSPADVRSHVAARLASFKVPAYVWIRTEDLPRNGTGKILKRDLREQYAASSNATPSNAASSNPTN